MKRFLNVHEFNDDDREKLESSASEANAPTLVKLLLRDRDHRPEPSKKGNLIPISPQGSQTDLK